MKKNKAKNKAMFLYVLKPSERAMLREFVKGTDYSGAKKETNPSHKECVSLYFYYPNGKVARQFVSLVGGFDRMEEGKYYTLDDMGISKEGD